MNDVIMIVDVVVLIFCFLGMGCWFDLFIVILMEIIFFVFCDLLMLK